MLGRPSTKAQLSGMKYGISKFFLLASGTPNLLIFCMSLFFWLDRPHANVQPRIPHPHDLLFTAVRVFQTWQLLFRCPQIRRKVSDRGLNANLNAHRKKGEKLMKKSSEFCSKSSQLILALRAKENVWFIS